MLNPADSSFTRGNSQYFTFMNQGDGAYQYTVVRS
jgi:hypothetical protein